MTLDEIRNILNASVLTKNGDILLNIKRSYCADLMSDVLAFSASHSLLITGLTNAQVVRTAEVASIQAIIFVQGKKPDSVTIALADEKKIPLIATQYSMFETCGRLYEKGLRSQTDSEAP